jgi:hypothetical protein
MRNNILLPWACGSQSRSMRERVRRRRSDDPGGAAEAAISTASGLAADDSIGPAIPAAEAAAEAVRMIECVHKAQTAASNAIAKAMAIIEATEDVYKIGEIIAYAKERVDCIDGSPETSASALNAITQAVASLGDGGLGNALVVAQKKSRDYLVWRTQIHTPLDDRTMFVELVRAAAGAGNMDEAQFSHVMHAHAKEVGNIFQRAFSSNAMREAVKRNRIRPARTRPENKNKLGEASGNKAQEVVVEVEEFNADAADDPAAAADWDDSRDDEDRAAYAANAPIALAQLDNRLREAYQPQRGLAAAWLEAGLQEIVASHIVWL